MSITFISIAIVLIIIALVAITILIFKDLKTQHTKAVEMMTIITARDAEIANKDTEIATKNVQIENFKQQLIDAQGNIEKLSPLIAENARLKEQIRLITEEKAKLQQEAEANFKNLANDIFDDKTKKFKELNESRLNEILTPLKEQISKFENTIHDNTKNEIKDREALREHIKLLMELNKTIGKEAKDLTNALKGNNKTQGDWGEMILCDILENCGLQEGLHYTVQQTTDELGNRLTDANGQAVRPDVVVKFPQDKSLVIDSKVSLTSYVDFSNEEDTEKKKQLLDRHITSVKRHIDELKGQKYQKAIKNSADFIMMFIPNEGAYIAAMQSDNTLWKYAYDNHVVIISPTHLVSVLKLVDQLWQHDKQTKNALKIAEETGRLYDKFAGFIDDMKAIDKSLNSTRNAYDGAMKKLTTGTGNILKRISDIKELGAKTSKTLSIEASEE